MPAERSADRSWVSRRCLVGDRCQSRGPDGPGWAESTPLCPQCLLCAERDVRALLYDFVDLQQALVKGRTDRERVAASREPATPLALNVEALQRTIHHELTTWEEIVREAAGLPEPPSGRTRLGAAVQRAVGVIAPRIELTASIGPVAVAPIGAVPVEMSGAEALIEFGQLHRRARGRLGLTRRIEVLYGLCTIPGPVYPHGCGIPALRREDGSDTVYCESCLATCTWDDYQTSVGSFLGLTDVR